MTISKENLETDLSFKEIIQTFSEEFMVMCSISTPIPNVLGVSITVFGKCLGDINDIKFKIYFTLHQPMNNPSYIEIQQIITCRPIDKHLYILIFCLTKLKIFCSTHCINKIDIPNYILNTEPSSDKNDSENKQLETYIKNLLDS